MTQPKIRITTIAPASRDGKRVSNEWGQHRRWFVLDVTDPNCAWILEGPMSRSEACTRSLALRGPQLETTAGVLC